MKPSDIFKNCHISDGQSGVQTHDLWLPLPDRHTTLCSSHLIKSPLSKVLVHWSMLDHRTMSARR